MEYELHAWRNIPHVGAQGRVCNFFTILSQCMYFQLKRDNTNLMSE